VSAHPGQQVEITAADQHAAVVLLGGGLREYSAAGRDLIDGFPADSAPTSGRGQVLLPWPNRLEDGTYEFDGRRHELPLTEPDRRNAIHGLVRDEQWEIAAQESHRVMLRHLLEPRPGYPFALDVSIEYALGLDGLTVSTTTTNVGPDACPFGSGQHPYIRLGTATVDSLVLRAPGSTVLLEDDRRLPRGREAVSGTELDFRRPRTLGAARLDDAFTDLERGPDGRARVELRDPVSRAGVDLWVDESYNYLMLFTGDDLPDVARRSLAVEPMTCPPNAFRTGEDLVRLEPGETATSRWGLVP
jgi:aldose 1-epimerase